MNISGIRKSAIFLALGLVALAIQAAVFHYLLPDFVSPNLLIIAVVYLSFFEISPLGAVLSFLLGLESDLCSGVLVGPMAGAHVLAFGLLTLFSSRLFVESFSAVMIAVFSASFISSLVYSVLVGQFASAFSLDPLTAGTEAILSACIAPFLFRWARATRATRDRPQQGVVVKHRPRYAA